MTSMRDPGFRDGRLEPTARERTHTAAAFLVALALLVSIGMAATALFRSACFDPEPAQHVNLKPRP